MYEVLTHKNFNEIEDIASRGSVITISKELALDTDKISYITKKYPNCKINILSGYDEHQIYSSPDSLFNEEETQVLVANANIIKQNTGETITFDNQFTLEEALNASRQINDIVQIIENSKVNGRKLSQYEKFLYAYSYVAQRTYSQADDNSNPNASRNLISVLNGDKIVCVGFANMLNTLCKRLKIPCTLVPCCAKREKDDDTTFTNHLACLVRMEDPLYGLNGIYYSDPTADSNIKTSSYSLSLARLDELPSLSKDTVYLEQCLDISTADFAGNPNFKPNEHNLKSTPAIKSFLFPEMTQGRGQDKVLRDMAQDSLTRSKTKTLIEEKIYSLTEDDMINSLKAHYRFNLMPHYLSSKLRHWKNFEEFTIKTISNLLQDGFSKQEAIEFLGELYDVESFINAQSDLPFTTEKERIDKSNILFYYKNHLENLVEQHFPEGTEKYVSSDKNEDLKISSALDNIVKPIVLQSCFNEEPSAYESWSHTRVNGELIGKEKYPIADLGRLIKLGVPIEEIKARLKKQFESFDLADEYLSHAKLSHYSDEHEAHFPDSYREHLGINPSIYNVIYEEPFAKLTENATPSNLQIIFSALVNINISKGMSKEEALKVAKRAISTSYDAEFIKEMQRRQAQTEEKEPGL